MLGILFVNKSILECEFHMLEFIKMLIFSLSCKLDKLWFSIFLFLVWTEFDNLQFVHL